MSVAQVGVEPTASLGLSKGGLPIAYRARASLFTSGGDATPLHKVRAETAECPVGIEPTYAGLEDRRLCRSAKGTKSGR